MDPMYFTRHMEYLISDINLIVMKKLYVFLKLFSVFNMIFLCMGVYFFGVSVYWYLPCFIIFFISNIHTLSNDELQFNHDVLSYKDLVEWEGNLKNIERDSYYECHEYFLLSIFYHKIILDSGNQHNIDQLDELLFKIKINNKVYTIADLYFINYWIREIIKPESVNPYRTKLISIYGIDVYQEIYNSNIIPLHLRYYFEIINLLYRNEK